MKSAVRDYIAYDLNLEQLSSDEEISDCQSNDIDYEDIHNGAHEDKSSHGNISDVKFRSRAIDYLRRARRISKACRSPWLTILTAFPKAASAPRAEAQTGNKVKI